MVGQTSAETVALRIGIIGMVLWILLAIMAFLFLLYLLMLFPGRRREGLLKLLSGWDYAHRGLHDAEKGIPENTVKAFEAAVREGYGAELDVQLTKDSQLVVFHDFDLKRMFGVSRKICDLDYEEISTLRIPGSESGIPLFSDVLNIFARKAPLIIEIKAKGTGEAVCRKVAAVLAEYQGTYCIESFNPSVIRWFRKHRPETVRGQLSTDYFREKSRGAVIYKLVMTHLLLNILNRPDFIAYNRVDAGNLSLKICRSLYRTLTVGWTIRSRTEYRQAKKTFDLIIFEGFRPAEKTGSRSENATP